MKRFGVHLLAAVATLLLLVANTFRASHSVMTAPRAQDVRLSHVLGMTVKDPNAQTLGTVKDLVFDARSARPEYAIIASSGVFGLGAKSRALPVTALSGTSIMRGVLGTSVTRQQWQAYPAFSGNLASLPAPARSGPVGSQPVGTLVPTGRAASQSNRLELASKLLGSTVVNREDQALGTVSDLFVDLNQQKPALALIRTRKLLQRPQVFAVPLSLLRREENGQLRLNTSPQRLEQAPLFSDRAWNEDASQGANTIYRVPGSNET